uniref:Histone deacetylase interacting domain-containing protein n=1 Tax=Kalanchoe fedtschenkoi TaxID=63787 RepID=A0A7N0RFU1_KALFE
MKRFSDDASRGPEFKRSSGSSRPGPYAQIQNGRAGDGRVGYQELTTTDALTYLQNVKEMFQDQRDKYDQFLDVMKDFKAQRTDTAGVIERVKELFKGHNNLIIGFNTFLPKGYEITLNDVELNPKEDESTLKEDEIQTKKTVEFQEAISFVNKIKRRFVHDDTVYKSFLDILNMYRKEQKGITEVYQEVSALLIDHHDLLEEFIRFLPPTPATPSTQNGLRKGNPIQLNYEKESAVPRLGDVPVQQEQRDDNIAYHPERVYYNDMDDDVSLMKKYKGQKKPAEYEVIDRRSRDEDNGDAEHDGTAYIKPQRLHDKRSSVFKVEGSGLSSDYDKVSLKSIYRHEFFFCQKVKERLSDPIKYQSFLRLLNIYSSNIVTAEELQGLVTKSLGEHPDLVDGFYEIVEHCENIDGFISSLMNNDSVGIDHDVLRSSKSEIRDKEKMEEMPLPRVKDRHREDYLAKSIQELDLSNCQRSTPSYRHLPYDYPIPIASQRSKLGTEVLNDYWVSVTSGSEDYSFKFMRRNQYEEALFKCEDDRFELDVLIETAKSTILRIEELLHKINEKSIVVDGPVRIEEHFAALHLRCIERLYGDHCLDAMDFLRKRFTQSLPVIAIRLKQRKEEWSKTRSGFNNVWAEVYAKNHYNSLDHRSFYFKQQDSKNLSSKSLLSEIKGIREAKRKEGALHMITIAGEISTAPIMEFEYPDFVLHRDLHRLVRFSCEEVCSTKEQSDKIIHFWSHFLAPIIGVASELLNSDRTGSVMKYMKQGVQEFPTAADKNNGSNSMDCDTSYIKGSGKDDSPSDKYNSIGLGCRGGGKGTGSDTVQSEKEQHAFMVTCKASESKGRGASEITPVISDVPHSIGAESRMDVEVLSAPAGPKRENNVEEPAQTHVSGLRPAERAVSNSKASDYHLLSNEAFKTEKEEGELSPAGESEDELEPWSKSNHDGIVKGCCSQEAVGENDAYAYAGDSGNAYMVDKMSGSNSGGDECSRQERDEEEVELNVCDSKVEDKAEAARLDSLKLVCSDGVQSSASERFMMTAKPLAKHVPSSSCSGEGKDVRVFYGNNSFYVFFRLHQILYDRLLFVKKNSTDSDITRSKSAPDCYSRFMDALYNLLDGTTDNEEYEDDCRALLGNQSYVLFTLDKLIYKLIKQLQTILTDEMDIKLLQLYEYETSRKSENYADSVYHENARVLLQDEEIFRFEFSSCPCRLSIQLLDVGEKPEGVAVALEPEFAGYLFNDLLPAYVDQGEPLGVVLQRNKCKLYAGFDEVTALSMLMEDVKITNRLECKIDCKSSKVSYVLGTEDVLFRRRRNGRDSAAVRSVSQSRSQQFHKLYPPPKQSVSSAHFPSNVT